MAVVPLCKRSGGESFGSRRPLSPRRCRHAGVWPRGAPSDHVLHAGDDRGDFFVGEPVYERLHGPAAGLSPVVAPVPAGAFSSALSRGPIYANKRVMSDASKAEANYASCDPGRAPRRGVLVGFGLVAHLRARHRACSHDRRWQHPGSGDRVLAGSQTRPGGDAVELSPRGLRPEQPTTFGPQPSGKSSTTLRAKPSGLSPVFPPLT